MKRLLPLLLALLLLCSCSDQSYRRSMVDKFDTVITVTGQATSEEAFDEMFEEVEQLTEKYHRIFDAYNEYDGVVNIATLNRTATTQPVTVGAELLELLVFSKQLYEDTNGAMNIAMGAVTAVWRDARIDEVIPDDLALQQAAKHCNIEDIVIDEQNSTVYLADPSMILDVGGVAKGFAADKIAEGMREQGYNNLLLSMGGNIVAIGDKDGNGWTVGIEDPNGGEILHKITLMDGYTMVVSGNYLRSYTVDGQSFGHIIDPVTLYPPTHHASVAVIAKNSAIADAFSTALFTVAIQQALELVQTQEKIEVLLVAKDGTQTQSTNFSQYITQ